MATVYLATDLRLERRVAIKIMHSHLADDSQFRERFIQEARSAARLAHPNVVNVFDQGQDSDMAYLVMEYLPGITLRDLLQEHKILTTEQTLDIMEAVLGGLAAAHKAGIVHRDLKPENVLLADDGRIKIGDFGLARAASANTATGAALLGTIAYLSPELVTRGIADARSDIYAVGIMMYEMLVGEQPFVGDQPMQIAYQHANNVVPSPSETNPQVPAELDELVLWATARDPDQRPRDARMLLDQLFAMHSALMTSAPTTSPITQRTMVLGAAAAASQASSTGETQVIGARPVQEVAVAEAVNPKQAAARRRMVRQTVDYQCFGGHRGHHRRAWVGISSLARGQSRTPVSRSRECRSRTRRLHSPELGLTVAVTTGSIDDPVVAVGLVADTDPPLGSFVPKGSEVQLLVSTGPKPLAVPAFVGMTEEQAREAIAAAPFTLVEPSIRQFDATVPTGIVIDALGADGATIIGLESYGELQPVTLVVSAGPLPNLVGLTVDEATSVLGGVGLNVGAINALEHSDTVPAGAVLRAQSADGTSPIRVGDTVDLITSLGVELVTIPDVVGQSWADAKQQLLDAGFVLDYDLLADAAPGLITVNAFDARTAELKHPKGSTVKVQFTSISDYA